MALKTIHAFEQSVEQLKRNNLIKLYTAMCCAVTGWLLAVVLLVDDHYPDFTCNPLIITVNK